jgi:hypothetical protein
MIHSQQSTTNAGRGSRGGQPAAQGDMTLQIMHINQRIKIKILEAETLAQFFYKVTTHTGFGRQGLSKA